MSIMREYESTSTLFGGNAPFIEEQYENYLANPAAVAPDWRAYFDSLRGGAADVAHAPVIESFIRLGKSKRVAGAMVDATTMHKQVLVLQMIGRFRTLGMFHAELDPLKRQEKRYIADLDLATYGFTDADYDTEFDVGSFMGGSGRMRLRDLIAALKDTYCRTLGAEYMYINDTATKRFVQQHLEPIHSRPVYTPEQQRHILERLTAAETLERYLHTKYVGQKRFSGEGGETMIPMLDHLIQLAGAAGVQELVIGMAHRGRLNVLVNTLGKMPSDLFSEFEGKQAQELSAGDVKYHQGFSSDVITPGGPMHLTLAFNPSHLEAVEPGGRGLGARAPASARRRAGRPGAAGADPRRRGDRRAGHHPGNAQHGADPRLLHGRHHPSSSSTTRSASRRRTRATPAARSTAPTSPRWPRRRSCTSTPTIRRSACSRSRWRSSTGNRSTATCSSTSSASAASATTRPTSRWSRSR